MEILGWTLACIWFVVFIWGCYSTKISGGEAASAILGTGMLFLIIYSVVTIVVEVATR